MAENQVRRVSFWEKAFGICALLYSSTAFIRLLMTADEYTALGDELLGSPVKRILWPITYLIAGYFVAKRYRLALDALQKSSLLVVLLTYIATSTLWSGSRTISILSVAALAGNTLLGLYFGVRYGGAEFLRLLGWVYGIIAPASFSAKILIGRRATDEGFWLGFFAQKNSLGMNMMVGFLVFVMLARRATGWRRFFCYSLAALCAILIFLSGSGTSLVILFVLVCAMLFCSFLGRYVKSSSYRSVLVVLILALSVGFVSSHWSEVLAALGKSEDLTGRVGIWGMLIMIARDRPFLGYGYGAFWVFGGPAQAVWDAFGADNASYAHNGYLQLLMDGGIVGVGLLLALMLTAYQKAWAYFRATKDSWPLYFFTFMVLHNLGEATFVVRNNICWLLFVAVLMQLVRVLPLEKPKAVSVQARVAANQQTGISSAPA